jgi:O-antigen ligase
VLGAAALVAASGIALLVEAPGPIDEALERFEAQDDPRRYIWDDASYSARRYWPMGAGMGTFDEVFQVDESLENLSYRTAGRAHNDYLELAIEAGIPGLALAGLWLALIGWLSWRARLSSQRWMAWAGSSFLLAIALQSITDYPLRNQTILAFAAFALLLLARGPGERRRERP